MTTRSCGTSSRTCFANGRGLRLYRSRLRSVQIAIEDRKLRARVVLAPMGLAATSENEVTEQVMNLREPSLTV